ncbi:MAG: right-handed parallel beta-helix repeat-containing protein [Proteobacteria bacterium]|nr:right-handed parallel beta-helix repeat-containing protein [Pseudomonadota bacterium]
MSRSQHPLLPLLFAVGSALLLAGSSCMPLRDLVQYRIVRLEAGPDFEQEWRAAFLTATPGTIFQLPAGQFAFEDPLTIESSHVVVRGHGMGATVLDFGGQARGSEAILARGDHFEISGLTIKNPPGTGIKTEFVDGATFLDVQVIWTRGSHPDNGDYGLYPAESRNIFISGCVVKGARDAGIYVGQSDNVVVRYSLVEANVLGIEIENSINADVYWNVATGNTAGIAILNLPDLKDGYGTRVFGNTIYENNTPNFAAGGILAAVPGGTGLIIIGGKDVEVYQNHFYDNRTVNAIASAFQISQEVIRDPDYDPYAEKIHIHDNIFGPGQRDPQGQLGVLISLIFASGGGTPDIVFGGYVDPAKIENFDPDVIPWSLQVAPENRNCLHDNGDASTGHLNGLEAQAIDFFDVTAHDCSFAPKLPVVLPIATDPPDETGGFSEEEIATLCGAAGAGVNWDAFAVNCPDFADYRLFQDDDPRGNPNPGGTPYDLTTPLFSDYADKDRTVFMPPGSAMSYSEDGVFEFPIGTIIAKTFRFEDHVVETRLLIHREDSWEGLPYIWNEDTSQATLAVAGGVARGITFTDPDGVVQTIDYRIPDMGQCGSCHFGAEGDVPIGPKARLLNRDFDYGAGPENQLAHFADAGLLDGAPADPGDAPRLPFWDDPADGTLEERARAYLESNCGHCHNPDGRAGFTSLLLVHDQPLDQLYGLCKRPIAAGSGAGGLLWDIDPGNPDESIMVFRMDSAVPAIMMPELSKSLAHRAGVELVSDWIATLHGSCE